MDSRTLALISNNLVYGAMAAFAVAFVAYAAYTAYTGGRRRVVAPPVAERVPVAVGSGAPVAVDALTAVPAAAVDRAGDSVVTGAAARDGLATGGGEALGDAAGRAGGSGDAPAPAGSPRWLGVGRTVSLLGILLLAGGVVARGLAAERVPWGNMYEFTLTGALVASLAFAGLRRRYGLDFLAVWLTGVVLLALGLAVTVLYVPVGPLVPALRSYWLVIHVFAAILSTAVFTVAAAASALQILKERAERRGRTGGYAGSLPSSGRLEEIAYRMTAFGFPVWTFAVVAGAIWAEASWGRYWGWDPKEVWALITWLAYAAYLHARTTAGWRGRRASVVALVAYGTLLFNFFGVNIFFSGLHSYGGL